MTRFAGFIDILKAAFQVRLQPTTLSQNRTVTLLNKTGIMSLFEQTIAASTAVRLDGFNNYSALTIGGAVTFTAATGAVAGAVTNMRVVADGVNVPNFGVFKKRNSSRTYVNTNGAVNLVQFSFDGTDYWYEVWQESGTSISTDGVTTISEVTSLISSNAVTLTGNQTIAGTKTFNGKTAFPSEDATSASIVNQSWTGSYGFSLQIVSNSSTSSPAFMAFHRPGAAFYFGLDTDNQFAFGGGSWGAVYTGIKSGPVTTFNATSVSPFRVTLNTPPANNAPGAAGEIRVGTDGFLYLCLTANSWRRVALSTY